MEWPANSLDINPNENLQSVLKHVASLHFPTTREELE